MYRVKFVLLLADIEGGDVICKRKGTRLLTVYMYIVMLSLEVIK